MLWNMLGGEFFRVLMIFLLRKALLGRRASLPVDWANGGPKNGGRGAQLMTWYQIYQPTRPEQWKKTWLPSLKLTFWQIEQKWCGKKVTANFHRKSSCDFQPESFRTRLGVGRAHRGWFAEHFERWFVGGLDNPLLGCTVWCVSKKERKNGHLDYFLKIWGMDMQWWFGILLSFTQILGILV